MGKITRRLAIGLTGIVGIGAVAYGGSLFACRFVPRKHPDFFALLNAVPDNAAARRIGRAIVAAGHAPADFDRLAALISQRPLIRTALSTDCPTTRKRLVQDQCSADFADGRMVSVDGWILSETEANLCAAAWLAEGETA
ncbi:hypothetical protein [Microbaculum sp. FT89]|uniref:hypothetical protein n=1 Tax=Microbaculum sp. FT89 TaxID=3447298 RepID=UPI003F5351DB